MKSHIASMNKQNRDHKGQYLILMETNRREILVAEEDTWDVEEEEVEILPL